MTCSICNTEDLTDLTDSPAPCVRSLIHSEEGQDLIEYALVAAIIGLGTIAGVNGVGNKVVSFITFIGNGLTAAL
jgi:pilus assembly protein Flp/PilA